MHYISVILPLHTSLGKAPPLFSQVALVCKKRLVKLLKIGSCLLDLASPMGCGFSSAQSDFDAGGGFSAAVAAVPTSSRIEAQSILPQNTAPTEVSRRNGDADAASATAPTSLPLPQDAVTHTLVSSTSSRKKLNLNSFTSVLSEKDGPTHDEGTHAAERCAKTLNESVCCNLPTPTGNRPRAASGALSNSMSINRRRRIHFSDELPPESAASTS